MNDNFAREYPATAFSHADEKDDLNPTVATPPFAAIEIGNANVLVDR